MAKSKKKRKAKPCSCGGKCDPCKMAEATKAVDHTALKARASKLVKNKQGKLVSKRSKTQDAACSQAMSQWKTSGMTPTVAATLGKCRAKARLLREGATRREMGQEARAQAMESRANRGGPLTAKDRLAKAKELRAQRKAGSAKPAVAVATSRPSVREQADAARRAKGTPEQRAKTVLDRAAEIRQKAVDRAFSTRIAAKRVEAKEGATPKQIEDARRKAEAADVRRENAVGRQDSVRRAAGRYLQASSDRARASRPEPERQQRQARLDRLDRLPGGNTMGVQAKRLARARELRAQRASRTATSPTPTAAALRTTVTSGRDSLTKMTPEEFSRLPADMQKRSSQRNSQRIPYVNATVYTAHVERELGKSGPVPRDFLDTPVGGMTHRERLNMRLHMGMTPEDAAADLKPFLEASKRRVDMVGDLAAVRKMGEQRHKEYLAKRRAARQ